MAFAKITYDKNIFQGLVKEKGLLIDCNSKYQNNYENWSDLLCYWQDSITSIVKKYKSGSIKLTSESKNCRECHYSGLCRTFEQRQLEECDEDR